MNPLDSTPTPHPPSDFGQSESVPLKPLEEEASTASHKPDCKQIQSSLTEIPGLLLKVTTDSMLADEARVSAAKSQDFKIQNEIVKRGTAAFIEVGEALVKIREGELWQAGGYKSWAAYCRSVAGLSKSYANRIIEASSVVLTLKEAVPIGATSDFNLPTAESQVRPLLLLETPEQCSAAWTAACTKSVGGRPTAADVKKAVMEILPATETSASKPPKVGGLGSPVQVVVLPTVQATKLLKQLRQVLEEDKSWAAVERILAEMENLLSCSSVAA